MNNTTSLFFYLGFFLLSVFFVYLGNKKRAPRKKITLGAREVVFNPLLLLGVLIPILIAGFRQGVGTDFNNYVEEYNMETTSSSYLEVSFNIISSVSGTLFGSPTFMFIVFSAMTVIPVLLAINKSSLIKPEYRWVFWMLFLFIMFPQTFNLLRQGVSVAIGFYLIISIIESRKLFKVSHILYLLLAVSFHTSAWILAPIGLLAHLMNNTRSKSIVLAIFMSSVIGLVCFSLIPQVLDLLGGTWSSYLGKESVSRSVIPRSALILLILMICWKYYKVLKLSNSYIILLWIGLIINIGGLFIAYFERIGYYVTLLIPLLILTAIVQFTAKSQLVIVRYLMFIFAFAYFIGVYFLMGSSDIFPYNWSF